MPNSSLPALLGGEPVRPGGSPDWPVPDPAVAAVFEELVRTGDWGRYEAEWTTELRSRLATRLECEHVLLCGSGTAAGELALRGVGVKAGDEVILAAYDFKANFTNVAMLGARPVLADIDPDSGQLAVEQVGAAIGPKTAAIVASHLHGGTVDMRRLMELAGDAGVAVIEDACQVSPATVVQGKPAGRWGDVGVLSFGGSKLLTAGRGGAVVTNRADIAQRIKLYTHRGNEAYPLSEMQAAILLPQLDSLDRLRQLRQAAVKTISQGIPDDEVLVPFAPSPDTDSSTSPDYYKLGFWYDEARCEGLSRDRFCRAMRAEGIPLDAGFRALHKIHARSRFTSSGNLAVADRADRSVVVLHHPLLLEGASAGRDFLAALDKVRSHARMIRDMP